MVLLSALFRIAFSKWASVIFLFMEIIQLIAINADHELQHIVDQRRKPCRVISSRWRIFEIVCLVSRLTHMAACPSEHFTGRKNVCSKSGSKIFFAGILICPELFWNPAGIVPAAGTGGSAFESTVLLRIVGSASSCFRIILCDIP
ncbi:MAG: hypothetical protein ACLSGF_02440 [Alistipes onderdonkii]